SGASIFRDSSPAAIYTLPRHDALPILPAGMPPVVVWMLGHVQVLVLGSVLVSAAKLACSIGLLKRRNWARLGFVALLGLAIACRSEEHTSELQSRENLVCRLLLEKKKA